MSAPGGPPGGVSEETLGRVVRQAVGDMGAVVEEAWTVSDLPVMWPSPVRAGIYRVAGSARVGTGGEGKRRTWSAVLRVAKPPAEGRSGAREGEWRYWRREACLVRSGLLEGVETEIGLWPPRTYLIEDTGPEEVRLWQEDLAPPPGAAAREAREALHPVWEEERLWLAARHLGEMSGFFLRKGGRRPVPDAAEAPWLCRTFLPQFIERVARWERWAAPLLEDAAAWERPLVREAFPDAAEVRGRMRRLHGDVPALLAAFETLPKTLCHLDAWPANLFRQEAEGIDRRPVTRAIDWEFASEDAVGADLGQLVLGSLSGLYTRTEDAVGFYRACVEAYVEGLLAVADAGACGGEESLILAARLGAAIFGTGRWGWSYAVGAVRELGDPEGERRLEEQYGLPIERIARLRGAAARLALGMADEARELMKTA